MITCIITACLAYLYAVWRCRKQVVEWRARYMQANRDKSTIIGELNNAIEASDSWKKSSYVNRQALEGTKKLWADAVEQLGEANERIQSHENELALFTDLVDESTRERDFYKNIVLGILDETRAIADKVAEHELGTCIGVDAFGCDVVNHDTADAEAQHPEPQDEPGHGEKTQDGT